MPARCRVTELPSMAVRNIDAATRRDVAGLVAASKQAMEVLERLLANPLVDIIELADTLKDAGRAMSEVADLLYDDASRPGAHRIDAID